MTAVKVGVIGLGAMGINHARVYHDMGADLVAVADPDETRGRLSAQRFHTRWVRTPSELLGDPSIEAVSLAVPTSLHHRLASEALLAGKHVLVEKPICETAEQAIELIALAKKVGRVLAVGHIERHNPVTRAAKELIASGAVGPVLSVSSRRVSSGGGRIKDVGVILDLAIHDIDVVRYLVGSEVRAVYAAASGPTDKVEDRAHILLEFDDGVFANIEANWRSPIKVRKLALTCERSHVELDYIAQALERATSHILDPNVSNLYTMPREYESHRVAIQNQEPLKNELRDFLDAVRTGHSPLVRGEDGLAALRIAQAAIRSSREHRRIIMDQEGTA